MKKILISILLGTVLAAGGRAAGESWRVVMKNGDILSGAPGGFEGRSLVVRTEYAGPCRLPLDSIQEAVSPAEVEIGMTDGRILRTRLRGISREGLLLTDGHRTWLLPRPGIAEIRLAEGEIAGETALPDGLRELKEKSWKAGLDLGFTLSRNGTRSEDLYLRFQFQHQRRKSLYHVRGYTFYGLREHEVYKKNVFGAFRYDYKLGERFFCFGQASGEYSLQERLDLRHGYNLGAGYYAWKSPRLQVLVDGGTGYQQEIFMAGHRRSDGSALLEQQVSWKPHQRLVLEQKCSFIPYITGGERFRLLADISVKSFLNSWFAVSFGVINKYDSRPQPGIEKNDFMALTTAGLAF